MVVSVEGCVAGVRDGCGRPVPVDRAAWDRPAGQLLVIPTMSCAGLASDARRTGTEFALDTGLLRHALHDGCLRVLAVALLVVCAMVRGRERDLGSFLA